jgi:hypothetical protein
MRKSSKVFLSQANFIKYTSLYLQHFYEDASLPALKQTEYINQDAEPPRFQFSLAHAPQINVIYWGVHTEHTL